MEWLIRFIVIWIIFTILGGWKKENFKNTIWCGLLSMSLNLLIDTFFEHSGLYKVTNPIISIWDSSLFFTLGPALCSAMIFAQLHPKKMLARVVHILVYTGIFATEELLCVSRRALVYINWSIWESMIIDILVFATLSWFIVVVLERRTNEPS